MKVKKSKKEIKQEPKEPKPIGIIKIIGYNIIIEI